MEPPPVEAKALGILLDLDKVWGRARIGLALSAATHSGTCLSSTEIARQTGLNRTTVLDHMGNLLNVGRAESVKTGRNMCYRASTQWARYTREKIKEGFT